MNTSAKPSIEIPESDAPSQLQVEDLVIGEGDEANAGDNVSVHYVGVAWSDGKQFDASWDRSEPLDIPIGEGKVIKGWDQGIPGMRVGGRRKLTIPADLAYGDKGAGTVIKPGETLVFVVDLLNVG
jgi:peptidylprolyl isomerase